MVTDIASKAIREKVSVSPFGLEIQGHLSFEEWKGLAPGIGRALRSCAFVVGDWLLYGEGRFAPPARASAGGPRKVVTAEQYGAAHAATGIDPAVLANYAYVARNVPRSMRRESLSWEHHRAVAKLQGPEQTRWLDVAEREDISSRRLRVSITRGRVVSIEELCSPVADPGIPNHITSINRLSAWWGQVRSSDWLEDRTAEQLKAVLRDFAPVQDIIGHIQKTLQRRGGR